ncbi:putative glycosyltransferase 6 domain-containing protein 1 isoform X4 [Mastomys coucha]|uniref:putative glycosyltransferase 6 domain-containing protein 1 isoform X4 n=1 Tax=Mastomys coucha TaxID=35658 RepID=UPI00126230A2|nr:putative glycosyltransferase 6 domain-containing protein 1 isoform X4 [Mastomys coucha]
MLGFYTKASKHSRMMMENRDLNALTFFQLSRSTDQILRARTKDHLQKMYACWKDHLEEPQLSTWFNPNLTRGSLRRFIKSADKYFLVGYNVIFYILADSMYNLPYLELGPLRTFKVWRLFEEDMYQDCNLRNMANMQSKIIHHIQYEVNFLFMMSVNQIFKNNFGVETLGRSVAQLHTWWYFKKPRDFPYERRTKSTAFIPFEEGDFYYHRAIVGGTPLDILDLIEQYIKGIIDDSTNKLYSTFESHLNKYFFINKPARVLSPEYNWNPKFKTPPEIKHIKIAWHP